jgi:hypothetical protein
MDYIQVTESFFVKNNFKNDTPNILNIVKDLYGRYVTSKNSYDDFTYLFNELYDFVLVDEDFYNQYNGNILIPEMYYMYVRKTNDNKYVVETKMLQYFLETLTVHLI